MTTPIVLYTDPHAPVDWDKRTTFLAKLDENNVDSLTHSLSAIATDDTRGAIQLPLWQRYSPTQITSYQWERHPLVPRHSSGLVTHLHSIFSNIVTPGTLGVYSTPTTPLSLTLTTTGGSTRTKRHSVKPPFLAMLMGIELANPALLSSVESKDAPVTFISHRHSLKKMLTADNGKPWRVDVQRVGNVIYMRKYQDYKEGDLNSIGRQFEAACATNSTDGERLEYRSIMRGTIGRFNLITSSEIDMCSQPARRDDEKNDNHRTYIELKTAMVGSRSQLFKMKTYFVQSFIGGVPNVVFGYHSRDQPSLITNIELVDTDTLIDDAEKNKLFNRLHTILSFIADHVEPGMVYALVQQKVSLQSKAEIALYKVDTGFDTFPIVTEEVLTCIKEVVAEVRKKECEGVASKAHTPERGPVEVSEAERFSETVFRFPFVRHELKIINCRECRRPFEFDAFAQAFHAEKGYPPPVRCKGCRERKKKY